MTSQQARFLTKMFDRLVKALQHCLTVEGKGRKSALRVIRAKLFTDKEPIAIGAMGAEEQKTKRKDFRTQS